MSSYKENTNISLNKAISSFNLSKIKELISQGINVNQVKRNDDLPLMLAIKLRRADIVKLLLEAGADLYDSTYDLYDSTYIVNTPLSFAASKGSLEIVKLLLQAGANPNQGGLVCPLHRAVVGEYSDVVRMLIEAGADIDYPDDFGMTALINAAVIDNLNIAQILVDAGANVNATENTGKTALVKAAECGHQLVFDYLFPLTSNIEQRQKAQKALSFSLQENPSKKTKRNTNFPLIEAISNFDLSKIKKLISQGTNVNQFDLDDTLTPLTLAIEIERADIVKILLDAGANIHESAFLEDTPLAFAASEGNLEIVKLLLLFGANPNHGGYNSPLHKAASIGYTNIVKTLIEEGADVNYCDLSGITPLMCAVQGGNLSITKILINAGTDVNAIDEDGKVALNHAASYGYQEIFDYLFPISSNLEQKECAIIRLLEKDKQSTFSLIYILKDDWEKARKAAAWALGEIQDKRAAEPLIKALQDRDKEVRQTAKEALLKIIDKHPEIENIIPF